MVRREHDVPAIGRPRWLPLGARERCAEEGPLFARRDLHAVELIVHVTADSREEDRPRIRGPRRREIDMCPATREEPSIRAIRAHGTDA